MSLKERFEKALRQTNIAKHFASSFRKNVIKENLIKTGRLLNSIKAVGTRKVVAVDYFFYLSDFDGIQKVRLKKTGTVFIRKVKKRNLFLLNEADNDALLKEFDLNLKKTSR